jgi:hypothetical protein
MASLYIFLEWLFFIRSYNQGYEQGYLSISQKTRIITCLPKEGKSKLYSKDWRPISLLNVDYTMCSSELQYRTLNHCVIDSPTSKHCNDLQIKKHSMEWSAFSKSSTMSRPGISCDVRMGCGLELHTYPNNIWNHSGSFKLLCIQYCLFNKLNIY